jgi:hypothetical protein
MRRTAAALAVSAFLVITHPAPAEETPPPESESQEVGPSRLLFTPTARSVPKGKGTVAVTEIAFPWVEVGVFDRFSVQAIPLLPMPDLTGAGGIIVAPKLQVLRTSRFQAAVGTFQAFEVETGATGGIAYGVATAGGASGGLTAGYGVGYGGFNGEGSWGVLFVGADKSLGRSVRLMAEGLFTRSNGSFSEVAVVGAVRASHGRWSADLGFILPLYETGSGFPFPVLTVAWGF